MPLLIRELNIKINLTQDGQQSTAGTPTSGEGGRDGKRIDAATVKRAVEEVLRIQATKEER